MGRRDVGWSGSETGSRSGSRAGSGGGSGSGVVWCGVMWCGRVWEDGSPGGAIMSHCLFGIQFFYFPVGVDGQEFELQGRQGRVREHHTSPTRTNITHTNLHGLGCAGVWLGYDRGWARLGCGWARLGCGWARLGCGLASLGRVRIWIRLGSARLGLLRLHWVWLGVCTLPQSLPCPSLLFQTQSSSVKPSPVPVSVAIWSAVHM